MYSTDHEVQHAQHNDPSATFSLGQEPYQGAHDTAVDAAASEMDWEPSYATHTHKFEPRNRQPEQPPQSCIANENQYNPFRHRVPAAVVTPAQRARNPPNKPALRGPSQATKETFFRNIMQQGQHAMHTGNEAREIQVEPQKFFFQAPDADMGDALAESLTSTTFFSMSKDAGSADPGPSTGGLDSLYNHRWHLLLTLMYIVALLLNQRMQEHWDGLSGFPMTVLGLCIMHAVFLIWSTRDGHISCRDQRLIIGLGEMLLSLYMSYHCIWVHVGERSTFILLRASMFGIVALFEGWLALHT